MHIAWANAEDDDDTEKNSNALCWLIYTIFERIKQMVENDMESEERERERKVFMCALEED